MNIIEVKNNLVRLAYEEDLKLSELIKISDSTKSYIAQILHLDSNRSGKNAVAKIIFNYDGQIRGYDGSIPSLRASVEEFDTNTLMSSIKCESPLILGKIAGQKDNLVVDFDILNDNPIIISEKFYTTKFLLNNIAMNIQARKKKLVVFDSAGVFKTNRITLAKDFKLPLNHSAINYIYDKEFADATEESKLLIQSVFEELGEYAKTVDFIPFNTFKSVIDNEFERTKLIQLVAIKNKLKQIKDKGIFAQTSDEIEVLKTKLKTENTVIINLSGFSEYVQQECIKYVYSILKTTGTEYYAFTPFNSEIPEKEFISDIFSAENIHTIAVCDYGCADLTELKKISKNMLMFTPIKQQKDFGGYNIFLQKLAEDEFIAYGKMTKFVPIISKLFQLTTNDIDIPEINDSSAESVSTPNEEQTLKQVSTDTENNSDTKPENIDVTASAVEETIIEEETEEQVPEETEETIQEEVIDEEENTAEEIFEEQIAEDVIQDKDDSPVESFEAPQTEEITQPETKTIDIPETVVADMAGASANEIKMPQQETVEEPIVEQNEVQEALNQVPDMEDDEELSDDDLDMIEKLSKPDEEIPVLNEQTETEPVTEPIVQNVEAETEPVSEEPVQENVIQQEESKEEQTETEIQAEIDSARAPAETESLQTRASSTPIMPEYSSEIPEEDRVNSDAIGQGDRVYHNEFGEGVVEKMINYGDKILCSINFSSVGRRLLNPEISEMRKI